MVCLEILTGKQPYSDCVRDAYVIHYLTNYILPSRPTEDIFISRGLDDLMWKVMLSCWGRDPRDRPSMAEVKRDVRALQARRSQLKPVLSKCFHRRHKFSFDADPATGKDGPLTNSPGHISIDLPGTVGNRQDISSSPSGPSLFPPSVTLEKNATLGSGTSPPVPARRRISTSTTSPDPSLVGGVSAPPPEMLLPRRPSGLDPVRNPSLEQIPDTNGSLEWDIYISNSSGDTKAEDPRQMQRFQRPCRGTLPLLPSQPSLLAITRPTQILRANNTSSHSGIESHLHSDSSSSEGFRRQQDEGISVSPHSVSSLHSGRGREASFSSTSSYQQPNFRYHQRGLRQLTSSTSGGQPISDSRININSRTGKVIS